MCFIWLSTNTEWMRPRCFDMPDGVTEEKSLSNCWKRRKRIMLMRENYTAELVVHLYVFKGVLSFRPVRFVIEL